MLSPPPQLCVWVPGTATGSWLLEFSQPLKEGKPGVKIAQFLGKRTVHEWQGFSDFCIFSQWGDSTLRN